MEFTEEMIEAYSQLLPPNWCKVKKSEEGEFEYFNEVTEEVTDVKPFLRYMELMDSKQQEAASSSSEIKEEEMGSIDGSEVNLETDQQKGTSPSSKGNNTKYLEYHCQWSERESSGKTNVYGLVIRLFEDHKTMIKFDGIDGEWVFTSLEGPYGALTHLDLFIGAKVSVFGRHLTISSASHSAQEFIEKEAKKLQKRADVFREKIMSVGSNPCVKADPPAIIRTITR